MTTDIEYALMAGRAYYDKRAEINRFPVPVGWYEPLDKRKVLPGGFEAGYFQRGSEIVISFTGTDQLSDWTSANVPLAFGLPSDQLRQAAQYYLDVKAVNPSAVISFTGHSLGGGLAALMGVLFDEQAVTFDQAPFANAAKVAIRDDLVSYLHGQGYSDSQLVTLAPELLSYDGSSARSANVSGYYVQGEILQLQPFSTIGSQTVLSQTSTGLGLLGSVSLHSIALLNAFLENKDFEDITAKLPDLLAMVFDSNLFARTTDSTNKTEENLIERLVRHQTGNAPGVATADQMLTRFTHDLQKLAQDGGLTLHDNNPGNPDLNEVSKALVAFAMQFYYANSANAINATKELFSTDGLTGAIQFDRNDVADALAAAKGYNQYLKYYLDSTNNFSVEEQTLIKSLLSNLRDWYIQAGTSGMTATDTQNRGDFMLGGSDVDTLTGGDKTDLLVGNAGGDTLKGGKGNDTLIGGTGNDTYVINPGDGFDTMLDSDGQGIVKFGGVEAKGSTGLAPTKWKQLGTDTWVDSENGITYSKSVLNGETRLLVHKGDSNVLVNGWAEDELGIALGAGTTSPDPTTTDTLTGTTDANYLDSPSTSVRTVLGDAGRDLIWGSPQADILQGGADDDWIIGYGGADHIQGRDGNDYISGMDANSVVEGGAGNDILTAFSSEWVYIQHPNNPITADVFWKDTAGVFFNTSYSNVYQDNSGNPTIDYGAGFRHGSFSGASSLGGRWTYQFTISGGAWTAKYFNAQSAPEGIDPVNYAEHRLQGQVLTGGVNLLGGESNDLLIGNAGADLLDGGAGDDSLIGGGRDDGLFGETGNDQLWGDEQTEAGLGGQYHGSSNVLVKGWVANETVWKEAA